MPSLKELVKNLSNFQYYSGQGNFTTNNLPYGNDRPGGGNSGQPYITVPLDSKWGPSNFDDGILPFGYGTAAERSFYDVKRIGKFFLDAPKGPLWLVKQTGLQRMNPKIQLGGGVNPLGTGSFFQRELGDTRLYNPLGTNTLAQVASNAFGVHFTRHGLLPHINEPNSYAKQNPESNTKFKSLRDKFATPPSAYNTQTNLIAEYSGGPDSYLGIGKTRIIRATDKPQNDPFAVKDSTLNFGFTVMPMSDVFNIGSDSRSNITDNTNPTLIGERGESVEFGQYDFSKIDFRKYKNQKLGATNLEYSDYEKYNVENRIGVMRTKYATKNSPQKPTFFSGSLTGGSDRVNMVSLYSAEAPGDLTNVKDINGNNVDTHIIRDLVKFRIKAFDNDKAGEWGTYMVFRAFITSFSDNMTSNWTPYSYVGRGESFYLYDGFTQNVSVGFKIAAFSRDEMKPLYQKLNYLKSCMAPDYSNSGKMRGNVMELTIGDYFHYQPGIITDLSYTIPQEANWEIALDYGLDGDDKDMHELPQMLDVIMTFIPIYRFRPQKSYKKSFIGIDDYRRYYDKDYNVGNEITVGKSRARDWTLIDPVNQLK